MNYHIFTEIGKKIGLGHYGRTYPIFEALLNKKEIVTYHLFQEEDNDELRLNKMIKVIDWKNKNYISKMVSSESIIILDSYLCNDYLISLILERCNQLYLFNDGVTIEKPKLINIKPSVIINHSLSGCVISGIGMFPVDKAFNSQSEAKSTKNLVIINLGGSIVKEFLNAIIIETLNILPLEIKIGVIYPNNIDLADDCISRVVIYSQLAPYEISNLYKNALFIICSAGVSAFEAINTSTPFIPIKINNNQENNLSEFISSGLAVRLDFVDVNFFPKLKHRIDHFLHPKNRIIFSNKLKGMISSNPTHNLVNYILKKTPNLTLRPANIQDKYLLHKWVNEVKVRENSFNSNLIPFNAHYKWLKSKLLSLDSFLFIAETEKNPVGQIRCDRIIYSDNFEIDYSISDCHRGRGFGKLIILALEDYISKNFTFDVVLIGKVKLENEYSINIFRKLDYIEFESENYISFSKVITYEP